MEEWQKFEEEICEELRKHGIPAIRTSSEIHGMKGDVETAQFLIECTYMKNRGIIYLSKPKLERTLLYAEKRNKIPLLVFGIKETKEKYVIIRFKDFIKLLKDQAQLKKIKEIATALKTLIEKP